MRFPTMRRFARVLAYLYPPACLVCDSICESGNAPNLCGRCKASLVPLQRNRCPVCAIPYSSEAALSYSPEHRCGNCRKKAPYFSRTIIPFAYEGPLVKAVQNFKYYGKTALSRTLVALLIEFMSDLPEIDVVLAIPLHPSRLRERGFNQAALLAQPLAKYLQRPFLLDNLERVLPTSQQVGLAKEERIKNIRRAFVVHRPEAVRGKHILLVDDVFTTGATFNEAAKVLTRAKAKRVIACALARMI